MRIGLSFHRIFGIRPWISFDLSELTRLFRRGQAVLRREDIVVFPKRSQEQEYHMTADLSHEAKARLAEVQQHLPPLPEYPLRDRIAVWVILAFAVYGFISMIGCAINLAHARTCVYFADGENSVRSCEDGSYTVTDPHGRVRTYGTPNAGFERYPAQPEQPVYERRV